jgi:chromate transporter
MRARQLTEYWTDITTQLLKIGATAYGGPAIMGVMQVELQEKRHWVSKERFMEGLSLVNMLPGATAAQLTHLPRLRAGRLVGRSPRRALLRAPGFLVLLALTPS